MNESHWNHYHPSQQQLLVLPALVKLVTTRLSRISRIYGVNNCSHKSSTACLASLLVQCVCHFIRGAANVQGSSGSLVVSPYWLQEP